MRIGVAQWGQGDGLASAAVTTLAQMGHEAIGVAHDARLPNALDVLIAHGPFGSLVPLARQLQSFPRAKCPVFVLWLTEGLPNPMLPEWIRYPLAAGRSLVERWAFCRDGEGIWKFDARWRWLTAKGHRFRYYGDMHWLRRQGIPFVLAVGSEWNAAFLRARGLDPIVAYVGFEPGWQADLGLERDIPVLWIGKMGSDRRRRLLNRVRASLQPHGIDILMIDGVENPYVFGQARTVLLNRTQIVLNVLRSRWDNTGLRYYLAAPNRALIVTEPTLAHTPFIAGVHLVEAHPGQLADAVRYYLSHSEERQRVVEQAFQLVTTELTMERGCTRILEKAAAVRAEALETWPQPV